MVTSINASKFTIYFSCIRLRLSRYSMGSNLSVLKLIPSSFTSTLFCRLANFEVVSEMSRFTFCVPYQTFQQLLDCPLLPHPCFQIPVHYVTVLRLLLLIGSCKFLLESDDAYPPYALGMTRTRFV